MKTAVLPCLLMKLLTGCTMTDVVRLEPNGKYQIPDRPYERLGKISAESWGICCVYALPLAGSMESAKRKAETVAAKHGADAIINAECYSETHMPVLMLFGWKENHVSGDAIKYINN